LTGDARTNYNYPITGALTPYTGESAIYGIVNLSALGDPPDQSRQALQIHLASIMFMFGGTTYAPAVHARHGDQHVKQSGCPLGVIATQTDQLKKLLTTGN
tara:strand:- start:12946 stop:13248 length:303 start_codon:yes stop_codon:yes gene_type:complete